MTGLVDFADRTVLDALSEQELLRSRYEAFRRLERAPPPEPEIPDPAQVPIDPAVGLPVAIGLPDPEFLRGAILGHGSCIVRKLIDPASAALLKEAVVESLAARERVLSGQAADPCWYSEFEHIANASARAFTSSAGMLAADSPRGHLRMVEALRDHGVVDLATQLLGVRPALSVEKTVLRRVDPQIFASWHQDGAFLGERISTLDVWIALTRCGRTAPGLEIFPRRVDRVLPTGAFFSWDLSDEVLAREYPGVTPVMPVFEVGDAIIFDQLCVHRSGHGPNMREARLAIECWLFAPGSVPADYTGLLL